MSEQRDVERGFLEFFEALSADEIQQCLARTGGTVGQLRADAYAQLQQLPCRFDGRDGFLSWCSIALRHAVEARSPEALS